MEDGSKKTDAQEAEAPQTDDLKAAEVAARDALISAFLAWGDARWRQGYRVGFEEARAKAAKVLDEVIAATAARNIPQPTPVASGDGSTLLTGLVNRPMSATPPPKAAVLRAIKANPGLRGAEILKIIHDSGNALHERTFRTNLARLRPAPGVAPKEGNIVAYRNRWYAWPDVPEGYQLTLNTGEADQPSPPKENGGQ